MTEIQKVILDIYKNIKTVCEKYNIQYYAIGGTCIGAVRHAGFIPWDDDMDIGIRIEDMPLFLEKCREELPDYLQIYGGDDHEPNWNMFYKIIDTRTTFIEDYLADYPEGYKGIFIDVMPLVGIPSNKIKRILFIARLRLLLKLNNFRRYEVKVVAGNRLNPIMRFALRLLCKLVPYNYFWKKYYKVLESHPVRNQDIVGYGWVPFNLNNRLFKASLFTECVTKKFEDTDMPCPIGYDEYLTSVFGDYMKLPDPNLRITPHGGFVNVSTPFCYYQNNPDLIKEMEE